MSLPVLTFMFMLGSFLTENIPSSTLSVHAQTCFAKVFWPALVFYVTIWAWRGGAGVLVMPDEYINVPVPAELVPDVYRFIAERAAKTSPLPAQADDEGAVWDATVLQRAYIESPPAMRAVFDYLASRAGENVPITDVADGIQRKRESMKGILGAFGRRWKNRYKLGAWPFKGVWDHERMMFLYRMGPHEADVIKKARDLV